MSVLTATESAVHRRARRTMPLSRPPRAFRVAVVPRATSCRVSRVVVVNAAWGKLRAALVAMVAVVAGVSGVVGYVSAVLDPGPEVIADVGWRSVEP